MPTLSPEEVRTILNALELSDWDEAVVTGGGRVHLRCWRWSHTLFARSRSYDAVCRNAAGECFCNGPVVSQVRPRACR